MQSLLNQADPKSQRSVLLKLSLCNGGVYDG